MFTTKGKYRSFNHNIKNLIKQGQNDKIKSLIKGLAPSDLVDSSNTTLLHVSARYNNHDLTKHLIKMKCNVNATSAPKLTPLIVAAANNSFKTAQILIEANADMYATNSSNKSALQLLLSNKKIPLYLIKCCLEKVQSDDPSDEAVAEKLFIAKCPLHVVLHLQKPSVTRQIMERYGLIDDPRLFRTAMDLAFKLKDKENISLLLQFGAKIDISNKHAISFLQTICSCGCRDESNLKLIKAFLEKVTDWNSVGKESISMLHSIFRCGTKQVIDLFLQHNVNDYVKNKFPGHDLLVNLFGNEDTDARALLKQIQFDVNSFGENGCTALHFTAYSLDLVSAKTLLALGADPNIQDFAERVPLSAIYNFPFYLHEYVGNFNDIHNNLVNEKLQMVELLLQGGADPQLDEDAFDLISSIISRGRLELTLAQLTINESKGMAIKESILQGINTVPKARSVYEKYRQELESLKNVKVHGSITLYTILVSDEAKIADSVRNREVFEGICSYTENLHFYYISKLKHSVNRILHIIDLKEKAAAFICEVTGWPSSQYIILEKILGFLTYKDLVVFE